MSVSRIALTALLVLLGLGASPKVTAEWQADAGNRLQERAERAIERIGTKVERSQPFFRDAYAIAVWPGITRVAFGFGGAYGRGIVIEQEEAVGTVSYWQGSSGIQAGAKNFAMVIFFKDKESLEGLKRGDIQFTGQAGIDVATLGAAGTPAYNDGVAIMTITNFGLMAEFSAAGVMFKYRPYSE